MCGIVGLVSRNKGGFLHNDMEVLENLLTIDSFRGMDSTGVFGIDRNRQVGIMKVASHPLHLFACEDWSKFKTKLVTSGRIVVGHNRKATQGSISSENAHPFNENNIILVHNGTLRGDHKKMADTEVDSHAVCHAFNEQGAEAVIPTIDGAFAFVWWDMAKNRLFAVRNDERPLNLVMTSDLIAIVSEAWMAEGVLQRHGKKIVNTIEIEPGVLYEFTLDGDYTTKEISVKEEPNYNNYMGSNCDLKKSQGAGAGPKQETSIKEPKNTITEVNQQFPKGRDVLVKIWNFDYSTGAKRNIRVVGKVVEPNLPAIDFVCHIPITSQEHGEEMQLKMAELMDGYCQAKVLSYFSGSTCGPSIFVQNLQEEGSVRVWNVKISETVWKHVVAHCPCKVCQAPIYDEEAEFTVVEQRTAAEVYATCADCVEDKLPVGEIKSEFSERRLSALEKREPVSDKPTGNVILLPSSKNSPTLH